MAIAANPPKTGLTHPGYGAGERAPKPRVSWRAAPLILAPAVHRRPAKAPKGPIKFVFAGVTAAVIDTAVMAAKPAVFDNSSVLTHSFRTPV
jgi:hypothetical protein